MPNVSISPVFNGFQFFDNNGDPLSGGKLFQYEAGSSSIQQTTYTDDTGTTPNANPIVFDSSGRIMTDLWLEDGLAYNLVVTLADGTTVLEGVDNVIGVVASTPGGGGGGSAAIWNVTVDAPSFVSPTQFALPGNYSVEFAVGNRARVEVSAGNYVYGTVSAVVTGGGNTQVTIVTDSGVVSSGLVSVAWSSLTSSGRTVDAAGVAYNTPSTYSDNKTVGFQLKTVIASNTTLNAKFSSTQLVHTASGTDNYVVTLSPAITNYSVDSIWMIKFSNASTGGACTLNINGVGAVPLRSWQSSGTLGNQTIRAGQISQVAYSGTEFILLDPVQTPQLAVPSGQQIFISSGNYTVPAGVTRLKVSVQGGGGGGAQWFDPMGGDSTLYGGWGGEGGCAVAYIPVLPGQIYAVVVGASGAAGTDSGPLGSPFLPFPQPGGQGGNSTFGGTILIGFGGGGGTQYSSQAAANGGTSGTATEILTANPPARGYGNAGFGANTYYAGLPNPNLGGQPTGQPGGPGIVIVEW